jgi:hypothetical protein
LRAHHRSVALRPEGSDRGKLKARVNWQLTRSRAASFLERVALTDPGAAEELKRVAMPPEAELPDGAEYLYEAFWQLSTDRYQSGFGVHPIPFTAIDTYARRYEIEGEEFDLLLHSVRSIDEEFIVIMADRIKEETKKGGASGS